MAAGGVLAARDMPAERRGTAGFDRAHHLEQVEADMAAIGISPARAVVAEDLRDLQCRTPHRALSAPDRLWAEADVYRPRPTRMSSTGRAG
jgi:hypothetical protein